MSLTDFAQRIARAATKTEQVPFGPWEGAMRSVPADSVPPEYLAGGTDFLFLPRSGHWRRRGGTAQAFDSFAAPVGMLPAKWGAKCRQLDEFRSDSLVDGVPSVIALLTREDVAVGLDDGRFSTVWVRHQARGYNYTLGSEYNALTYPAVTEQAYKVVPLWYDSGDGGLTRGTSEFARRFLVSGSRQMMKVGAERFFPSYRGTPSRWNEQIAQTPQFARPTSDNVTGAGWNNSASTGVNLYSYIDEATADDADYIRFTTGLGGPSYTGYITTGMVQPQRSYSVTMRIRIKTTVAGGTNAAIGFKLSNATTGDIMFRRTFGTAASNPNVTISSVFVTYEYALSALEIAGVIEAQQPFKYTFDYAGNAGSVGTFDISWVEFQFGATALSSNRLSPWGPLSPLHAGSLARGNIAAGGTVTMLHPDADITDGAWTRNDNGTAVNLYQVTLVADDVVCMRCTTGGALCDLRLSDPGFTPGVSTHVVNLRVRAQGGNDATFTVQLYQGATLKASSVHIASESFLAHDVTLSGAEVTAISDWTDLHVKVAVTGYPTLCYVSYIDVQIVPIATEIGGWIGSDRFYFGTALRDPHGAILMPTIARAPNPILPYGWNLFTVDPSNPTTSYDSVVWSHLPKRPPGWSLVLWRSGKIDSTVDDDLKLDPYDMRIVWEIQDATTETYVDYFADDLALKVDAEQIFLRDDHAMTPRSRYVGGGESRVAVSYGGLNAAAIQVAPVGRVADWDLNLDETAAALWTQKTSYVRVAVDAAGAVLLTLVTADGTSITNTITINTATYDTLQKVVDRINVTTVGVDGAQWRAQLAPGANESANPATCLTAHYRFVDAVTWVSGSARLKRAAGGLGKVAVGATVSSGIFPTGAYVIRIESDQELVVSGNATSSLTGTAGFYFDLGDAPNVTLSQSGYQRVIGSVLPGWLYFNNTYLAQFPIERSSIWTTVFQPGAVQPAPNCFSNQDEHCYIPPHHAGISMGVVGVGNWFFAPFSEKRAVIRLGRDWKYHLEITNESSGCVSWASVKAGNGFAVCAAPEGLIAVDLDEEMMLSEFTYVHAPEPRGDFVYELPLCVAACGKDDDTAYLSARISRGMLRVNYRESGAHPNRQVVYDFSSGQRMSGLAALRRPGTRKAWGWSLPLVLAYTAMCEGRRADGAHLYAWNEQNLGTTGDGRIDEIEIGDTDNGVEIAASGTTGWLTFDNANLSGQEIELRHSSPDSAVVGLDYHRSFDDTVYALTPAVDGTPVQLREVKMLPLPARAPTAACYLGFRQSQGGASELRKLILRVKVLPDYK